MNLLESELSISFKTWFYSPKASKPSPFLPLFPSRAENCFYSIENKDAALSKSYTLKRKKKKKDPLG